MSVDVICFGEAIVDFFPDRPTARLREAEHFVRHMGGAPSNVAVGLARLGSRVRLLSAVGDDEFGAFMIEALAHEGVLVDAIVVDPIRRTGITFINVDAHGERTFASLRVNSAIDGIAPDSIVRAELAATKLVHLGTATLAIEPSRTTTLTLVEHAHQTGAVVSLDINWRAHLWPHPDDAKPLVERVLRSTQIVKVASDELEPVFQTRDPDRAAASIASRGPSVVIVTRAAEGCLLYRHGHRTEHPAPTVKVVDTTGAGDGFCAGFLASLARHLPQAPHAVSALAELADFVLDEACLAANHVGSQVVTAIGATTAIRRL